MMMLLLGATAGAVATIVAMVILCVALQSLE
jgi:hypothetical protein